MNSYTNDLTVIGTNTSSMPLDHKQESQPLTFEVTGSSYASNLTVLADKYILFQTNKEEQVKIHIYNKQKNQIIDEITIDESEFPSYNGKRSPFVALPKLGFITLSKNGFLIRDVATNTSQFKTIYSEKKNAVEIICVNDIFLHDHNKATFYCNISVSVQNYNCNTSSGN
jgi:hypothetical protein